MNLEPNVGTLDGRVRRVIGITLLLWAFLSIWDGQGLWGWGLFGVPLLLTSWLRWCPLYALIGRNTCSDEEGLESKKPRQKK